MFCVERKQQHLDHQDPDQRWDGEGGDTEAKPEIPGAQHFSSPSQPAREASQPPPRSAGESASSEAGSPRCKGSLSCLRAFSSGAQSTNAELPTTSKIPHGGEAPLASRLHPAQYQDCGCTNSAETLVTNNSNKSTEFEEEEMEWESSSASSGLSHHPQLKTTVPPVGSDGLSLSPAPVQSRPLIFERFKRGSRVIGRMTHIGRTSSPRRNRRQRKPTAVDVEEGCCAAQTLQSSYPAWLLSGGDGLDVLDGLDVDDMETFSDPKELEDIQECQAAQSLTESSEDIPCRLKQRFLEEISDCEDFCRICHSSDSSPADPLTSPCLCSGSMRLIHLDCLKKWTVARIEMGRGPYTIKRCELCNGMLKTDPDALNMDDIYRETVQRMIDNPSLYPEVAVMMALMRMAHRPSRFRRLLRRIRRWMHL